MAWGVYFHLLVTNGVKPRLSSVGELGTLCVRIFFNIGLLRKHEELARLAMKNARWAYVKTRYRENEEHARCACK